MIRKGLTSWVAKAVGSTLAAFLCLTFIIAGAAAVIGAVISTICAFGFASEHT